MLFGHSDQIVDHTVKRYLNKQEFIDLFCDKMVFQIKFRPIKLYLGGDKRNSYDFGEFFFFTRNIEPAPMLNTTAYIRTFVANIQLVAAMFGLLKCWGFGVLFTISMRSGPLRDKALWNSICKHMKSIKYKEKFRYFIF